MKILVMFVAMLLIIPAAAQRRSATTAPDKLSVTDGIIYSLPRTGIRVHVKARQTTVAPGPYAPFAEQLLGIRDAKTQAQTIWEFENVRFETFAEPDPAQIYKATGGAAFLQLTPSGILAGINSVTDLKSCISASSNSFATVNKAPDLTFNYLIDNPALTGRTSLDQRAVQAANRIIRARNLRFDIVSGLLDEFHPDGEAYKESLEELHNIEAELLSLFIGKSATEEYIFSFDYIPKTSVRGDVIFRFDENRGFLPKSDLSGKPVIIDVERDEALAAKQTAVKGEQPVNPGFTGVYYRQPGTADIRISREFTVVATGRVTIAQFGEVSAIPRELLDGTYSIEIHHETGAIKSIQKK
jgi:hypothetical protein